MTPAELHNETNLLIALCLLQGLTGEPVTEESRRAGLIVLKMIAEHLPAATPEQKAHAAGIVSTYLAVHRPSWVQPWHD